MIFSTLKELFEKPKANNFFDSTQSNKEVGKNPRSVVIQTLQSFGEMRKIGANAKKKTSSKFDQYITPPLLFLAFCILY